MCFINIPCDTIQKIVKKFEYRSFLCFEGGKDESPVMVTLNGISIVPCKTMNLESNNLC